MSSAPVTRVSETCSGPTNDAATPATITASAMRISSQIDRTAWLNPPPRKPASQRAKPWRGP